MVSFFNLHEVLPLNVIAEVASVKRGFVCFYIRPNRATAKDNAFLFGFNIFLSQKTKLPVNLLNSLWLMSISM